LTFRLQANLGVDQGVDNFHRPGKFTAVVSILAPLQILVGHRWCRLEKKYCKEETGTQD
jgi:hypothetical protein